MNILPGAIKIYEDDHIYNDVSDAIKFMKDTNFEQEVSVYDLNDKKARIKAESLYDVIRNYNKSRKLKDQILPTSPFAYRGIKGCLGVQCYSISLGTYERNHDLLPMFSHYVTNVLDIKDEKPDIHPSMKALTSLAMMSSIMKGNIE